MHVLRWPSPRYLAGVVLLAAAYYGAAKVGQMLRYTGSVSAIWPPAGVGIAALYLWGVRWWPGVLLGELVVNGQLWLDDRTFPVGSLVGQQAGNMAEIIVGALLLRRLLGPNAAMDRVEQVGRMLAALAIATAISATVGTISMVAGGVVEHLGHGRVLAHLVARRHVRRTCRAAAGARVGSRIPWARRGGSRPGRAPRWWSAVAALTALAFSSQEAIKYAVFPALIWAAFRFGPPGATLSIAITAGWRSASRPTTSGSSSQQTIDHRTLSTQLYIWVAASRRSS